MYRYDRYDLEFVRHRVAEFRTQVERRLRGELNEEEFKPLRLMNGLYLQLHAYMLRVAVPYGTLSSVQMRTLADLAEGYDRGYGHFTTRQNIQFNWPKLKDVPDMLEALAEVEMHAIQTSGNCIRNVTSDPYAGAAADEVMDPRPLAELLRQWSSLHPEFSYLPRKFKFAVTGAQEDRTALQVHDIGLRLRPGGGEEASELPVVDVHVGGGQGRTPRLTRLLREDLPLLELLPYLEALMRVYNRHGRRDNKYKARIKILVDSLGLDEFRAQIEAEYRRIDMSAFADIGREFERIRAHFAPPQFETFEDALPSEPHKASSHKAFQRWCRTNTVAHKQPGYTLAVITLKPAGGIPGDADAAAMRAIADLADRYSFGEIRITHRQNLVLPHVKTSDLFQLYSELDKHALASPNLNRASDIIACPGMDYCALATARSIPVAQMLSHHLEQRPDFDAIGPLSINISGCINACGHHHVANVGILGLDRAGVENYQITLGGDSGNHARIGKVVGPGFSFEGLKDGFDRLIDTYMDQRQDGEKFIDTLRRIGVQPFKDRLYAQP